MLPRIPWSYERKESASWFPCVSRGR